MNQRIISLSAIVLLAVIFLIAPQTAWTKDKPPTVTDSDVRDIADKDDPNRGGVRIRYAINTGDAAVRDFHVCIAEVRTTRDDDGKVKERKTTSGDANNGNYENTKAPDGWNYRGVQPGPENKRGVRRWYLTWVKEEGAEEANSDLEFVFDYTGRRPVRIDSKAALITTDGDLDPNNNKPTKDGGLTIASADSPPYLAGLLVILIVLAAVMWLAFRAGSRSAGQEA